MVKLEAKDTTFGGIFYFHNMEDCEEFLYVFKDHWCNVPWKEPILISDNEYVCNDYKRYMDISPKKRAEDSLSWGVSIVNYHRINLNEEQNNFIKSFIENN